VTFADVITAIEESFPFVARPPNEQLMEHPTGCILCDCEREWIMARSEPHPAELSEDAARGASLELSCYSASGAKWLMPSLLRCALSESNSSDPLVAERLLYSFAYRSALNFQERLTLMSSDQIAVIIKLFVFQRDRTVLRKRFRFELLKAIAFLRSLQS
jgi:hypothetical protein